MVVESEIELETRLISVANVVNKNSDGIDYPPLDEYDWKSIEREGMESEANISILNDDEILMKFKEVIEKNCKEIKEMYYFEKRLNINTYSRENNECKLLDISSEFNDCILLFKAIIGNTIITAPIYI